MKKQALEITYLLPDSEGMFSNSLGLDKGWTQILSCGVGGTKNIARIN